MACPLLDLKALPNYPALLAIHGQYFEGFKSGARLKLDHLSSHWRVYTERSQVTIGNDGHLIDVRGEGFGGYSDERLLKRMADYVCCCIHFLQMKHKRKIASLVRSVLPLLRSIPFGHHYVSYDLFRQICAVGLIARYLDRSRRKPLSILIIGDGYGFLAAMAKMVFPEARIVLVDIGRTLFFQALYLQVMYRECLHVLVGGEPQEGTHVSSADFSYCPADMLSELRESRYDLAINICSMQEMNNAEIERYFQYIRAHAEPGALFYCCNRESKTLPDGEKIEFESYPWLSTDRYLVDGYPLEYRFWFSTRPQKNGPVFRGLKMPFVDGPDGPVRHRLVQLSDVSGV